jgi:hypothetical protein
MLIFVPKLLLFTVAPTCDYCIYVMSLISRPFVSLPLPFHFGSRRGILNNAYVRRIGKGSSINDHASFLQVVSQEGLYVSQMAMEYAKFKASFPQKIFIVDFETAAFREESPLTSNRGYGPGRRRAYHYFLCNQRKGRHKCSVRGST